MSGLGSIVIVGASLAGLRAAEALRKQGFDGKLCLVGDEPHKPYDRPPLSKQVLSGEWPVERTFFRTREGYDALSIDWQLGQRAASLSPADHTLRLSDGTQLSYDGLVIATGARPLKLRGVPQLDGMFTLRSLSDAQQLRDALARMPRVVVIGAGFIGLEVAAVCRQLGLAVTLVEALSLPLINVLGAEVGASVARMHSDHGVSVRCSMSVSAIEGQGRVERVRLSDGTTIEADLVVVGIGVTPCTEWLQGSGVAVADGVLCDATCATNLPNIVAAGDIARWPNPLFDESMRVEHWSNAVEQAHAAAARLLGGEGYTQAFASLPYFWSDQYDVKLQFAGRVRADDQLDVVEGALGERSYAALYSRAGRLRGVLTSNRPAALLRYRKLIANGATRDAALQVAADAAKKAAGST